MLGSDSTSQLTPLNAASNAASFSVSPDVAAGHELVAGRLSVVIRAHRACDKALLAMALQSLVSQKFEALEVLVVTDAFERENQKELSALLNALAWRAQMVARLELVDCSGLTDSRSRLLNEGIARSTGQYLAFLDYDDVVYEDGYRLLVDELVESGKGVAAGGTNVAEVQWKDGKLEIENIREFAHDGRAKIDLWKGNFLPIHSIVINRFVVPAASISTEETLKRLEDHCLLLRLSFVVEFSLAKLQVPVCEYRVFNGVFSGDRTKFLDARDADIVSWKQSKEFIQTMIAGASATVNVAQLKDDIQDRLAVERARTEQQVRHEAQIEIESLKQRVAEAEQNNLSLSYQIEKWQAANKSLGAQLDQQNAELSRRPYKAVRALLSPVHKLSKIFKISKISKISKILKE